MQKLKLSFALIIAVLAVGVTFALKANSLQVITGCYEIVTITNGTGSDFALDESVTCPDALTARATRPYLKSGSSPLASEEECPPSDIVFCCVNLTELVPAQHPNAPLVDLGEGAKPYQVTIICKD